MGYGCRKCSGPHFFKYFLFGIVVQDESRLPILKESHKSMSTLQEEKPVNP